MTDASLEAAYPVIADAIRDYNVVTFLGAGVNLADRPAGATWPGDGLPSGQELARHLATKFRYSTPTPGCPERPCPRPPGLLEVSQHTAMTYGPLDLYTELHRLFSGSYEPTVVHEFVAETIRLRRRDLESGTGVDEADKRRQTLVLTTNYDNALERSLGDEPYDLIWYQADPRRSAPDERLWYRPHNCEPHPIKYIADDDPNRFEERPVIVKLHGAVSETAPCDESFVITEDHYIDYLSLRELHQLLPLGLALKLATSHILFLGYALSDWNMRAILHRVWAEQRLSAEHWAIQRDPPSVVDRKSWTRNNVEVFGEPLDVFVRELAVHVPVELSR